MSKRPLLGHRNRPTMMRRTMNALLATSAFAVALPLAGAASAQYTNNPFFDRMTVQSQAYGLELVSIRLTLVENFDEPPDEEFMELIEDMAGADLRRFEGTLAERNPELAANLREALEEIEETFEEGGDAAALVPAARDLLAQAYDIVIDPEIQQRPDFKAGVLADLLLADGGVAEGYEEAIEEVWAFSNGWAALQRVKVLWGEVAPLAQEQQRMDGEEMVVFLDSIYPSAMPPIPFFGNPEEAEGPAHRLVGILEVITDAGLYTGRDLGFLAGHLSAEVGSACTAFAAGNDVLGAEGVYTIRNHYRKHLRRLLDLVDVDVHTYITERLNGLISEELPSDTAAACTELQEGLLRAQTALGG